MPVFYGGVAFGTSAYGLQQASSQTTEGTVSIEGVATLLLEGLRTTYGIAGISGRATLTAFTRNVVPYVDVFHLNEKIVFERLSRYDAEVTVSASSDNTTVSFETSRAPRTHQTSAITIVRVEPIVTVEHTQKFSAFTHNISFIPLTDQIDVTQIRPKTDVVVSSAPRPSSTMNVSISRPEISIAHRESESTISIIST